MIQHVTKWKTMVLVALLWPGVAAAQLEVNVALGGQFGGTYDVSPGPDLGADGGFFSKLGVDYFFSEYFGIGSYLAYGMSFNGRQGDINAVEFGITLKPRYSFDDALGSTDIVVTPELMVGWRGSYPGFGPSSNGLALNFGLDLRARFENGFAIFVEPGFLTQPVGGNDLADVTFSPIGFVVAGVAKSF